MFNTSHLPWGMNVYPQHVMPLLQNPVAFMNNSAHSFANNLGIATAATTGWNINNVESSQGYQQLNAQQLQNSKQVHQLNQISGQSPCNQNFLQHNQSQQQQSKFFEKYSPGARSSSYTHTELIQRFRGITQASIADIPSSYSVNLHQQQQQQSLQFSSFKTIEEMLQKERNIPQILIVNSVSGTIVSQAISGIEFIEGEKKKMHHQQKLSCDHRSTQSSAAIETNKKSEYFAHAGLIFMNHFGKQFKLKQSSHKNDDIVFSKIKEHKKLPREVMILPTSNPSKGATAATAAVRKANSKFHNLNKLFMYKLLATFNRKNLIELGVPEYLHEILEKLIQRLKTSTKDMKQYNKKTEFFSHDHYNLLFLHLNERTLTYLAQNEFVSFLHRVCFDIDISASFKPSDEKIAYVNIIKRFCCSIVQNSNMLGVYTDITDDSDPAMEDEDAEIQTRIHKQNMRQAYTQRALKGINSLSQGIVVRRF